MDVASVDVIWNGFAQSLKIAALAETHELACAPHNYYSHLATFIAAQWCAAIPNVRLLEIDVDDVPWREELTTASPRSSRRAASFPAGRAGASRFARTSFASIPGRRDARPGPALRRVARGVRSRPPRPRRPRSSGGPYPGATALLLAACATRCSPSSRQLARPALRVAVFPALGLGSFTILLTSLSTLGVPLTEVSIRIAVVLLVAAGARARRGVRAAARRRRGSPIGREAARGWPWCSRSRSSRSRRRGTSSARSTAGNGLGALLPVRRRGRPPGGSC